MQFRISNDGELLIKPPKSKRHDLRDKDSMWINSGDIVTVSNDRIYFRGRANGAFTVAGESILPEEIEAIILKIPEVKAAQVKGKRSSITGNLVEANIVLNNSTIVRKDIIKKVKSYCADYLSKPMIPAIIKIVNELGAEGNGKLNRK